MKTIRHLTVYSMLLLNTLKPMIIQSEFDDWKPHCLQRMPEEILLEIAKSATGFSQEDLKAAPYYEKCIKFNPEKITLTPKGNSLIVAYQNIIKTISLVNKELYTALSVAREILLLSSKQELHGNPLLNLGYFDNFNIIRRIEREEHELVDGHQRECTLLYSIKKNHRTKKYFLSLNSMFFYGVDEGNTLKLPYKIKSMQNTTCLDHVKELLHTFKTEVFIDKKEFDPAKYIDLLDYFNTITYSKGSVLLVNPFQMSSSAECIIMHKENECIIPYKTIEQFINTHIEEDNQ